MKTVKVTLAANEMRPINVNGEFFFLRFAQYPVAEIKLTDRNGGTVSILEDAVTTDWDRSGPFERVEITNGATPQTIYFRYGNGDTGSNVFSGNVTGSIVSLDAPTIAALIARQYPPVSTGSVMSTAALSANTPITIFTPAANVNGAILLSADISEFDATQSAAGFVAKASAPTSVTDGEPIFMSRMIGAYATTNHYFGGSLSKEQYIAPGLGLYFIRTVALAASNGVFRACRVKLL